MASSGVRSHDQGFSGYQADVVCLWNARGEIVECTELRCLQHEAALRSSALVLDSWQFLLLPTLCSQIRQPEFVQYLVLLSEGKNSRPSFGYNMAQIMPIEVGGRIKNHQEPVLAGIHAQNAADQL